MPEGKQELLRLRLDYAWKYFEFHARQRVSMFNYFLILTGVLASAYVAVLTKGYIHVASALAILGTLGTLGFLLLELRNHVLVRIAEDVLRKLESDHLFPREFSGPGADGEILQLGFLHREAIEKPQQGVCARIIKHKYVIRIFEMTTCGFFVIGVFFPHLFPDVFIQAKGPEAGMVTVLSPVTDHVATNASWTWDNVGLPLVVSIGASIIATILISAIWLLRLRLASKRYCGAWDAFNLDGRKLVPMPGNPSARILRGTQYLHPEKLVLEAEYDGSKTEGRVKLAGQIVVNTMAANQAIVTIRRVGDLVEYAVQTYYLMGNGDLYVVPAVSEKRPPDYSKHVLRRRNTT